MKTLKIALFLTVIIILLLIAFQRVFFRPHIHGGYDLRIVKMSVIEAAIDTYKQHTGQYPNKLEDMISCPIGLENAWQGPYLKEKQMYDPWNRPYIYILDSNDFSLKSYGADGKPGGEGYDKDISNE